MQIVNGEERPIAFVSKSVSGSEVNWSTVEKECYAIYHSIQELEHLLSGRHFTLHTDHRNLLKLMEGGSKKAVTTKWPTPSQDYVPSGPGMFLGMFLEVPRNQSGRYRSGYTRRSALSTTLL
jgi:hypothetical protein